MGEGFLWWWFESHYILSTLLTPWMSFAWLWFTPDGNEWRMVACAIWGIVLMVKNG
jgi:hypothetical protein